MPRRTPVYQLKLTLQRSAPPVWRRALVPGNLTLDKLHEAIQRPVTLSRAPMNRSSHLFCVAVAMFLVACTGESDSSESTPPPNPIERRVEPVRERATEADSLMRVRAREVQELSRPES